jgi:hypothetical protein
MFKSKTGHCVFQIRPLGVETGQHPTEAALLPDYAALFTHERGVSVDLASKS